MAFKFADLQSLVAPALKGAVDPAGDLQSDVEQAKQAAVTYAVATLAMQLISTVAVATVAYVTWQNYKRRV